MQMHDDVVEALKKVAADLAEMSDQEFWEKMSGVNIDYSVAEVIREMHSMELEAE